MYKIAKFNSENAPRDNEVIYCIALFDSIMVRKQNLSSFQFDRFVLPPNILLSVPFALTKDHFMCVIGWNVL